MSRRLRPLLFLGTCWLLFVLLGGGCNRNILDFNIAEGGLNRPRLYLLQDNVRRVMPRIRWMEQIRIWEVQLQAHSLSSWMSSQKEGSLRRCSSTSTCSRCMSGDENIGEIDLSCWTQSNSLPVQELTSESSLKKQLTQARLSGKLSIEMETPTNEGGVGYLAWSNVCQPAIKMIDSNQMGICVEGNAGYKVKLDNVSTSSRLDFVWVIRLSIKEGKQDATTLRLDGVTGVTFQERDEKTSFRRTAIFLENKNVLYHKFSVAACHKDTPSPAFRECCGSVEIIANDGVFTCTFHGNTMTAEESKKCPSLKKPTVSLESTYSSIHCQPVQ